MKKKKRNKTLSGASFKTRFRKDLKKNYFVYLTLIPVLAWYIIFCYVPMWGVLLSFKDYKPFLGFAGSKWVGLRYFKEFFSSFYFERLVSNTLLQNLWYMAFGFTSPILLAILLNEVKNKKFKKVVQTITYMPYFLSLVVICGMIRVFVAHGGVVTQILDFLTGTEHSSLLGYPGMWRPIYTFSAVWQTIGWNSIIYLAAMTSIDPELYEAADIDGAGRLRKIWSITIPQIAPTIIIMFILAMGGMMSSGHEKTILLYNESIYSTADTIGSFVYRRGLEEADFSYATAVGLFSSVINFFLLWITNKISRKYSDTSLF